MNYTALQVLRIQKKQKHVRELLIKKYGNPYINYRKNWNKASTLELITDFPMHIDLDTVDACNLHCKYCTEEHEFIRKRTMKSTPDELIIELFKEISNPKGQHKLASINIGKMGEPFLYPDKVLSILDMCLQSEIMETFIHTNGHLLTLDLFKEISKMNLTYLFISLDALKEDTYSKLRGGNILRVMGNIMSMLDYKKKINATFPIIRVSFVESNVNHSERDDFIKFWSNKVDFIDIQPLTDYTTPIDESEDIMFSCAQPFQRVAVGVQGEIGLCCAGYIMLPKFSVGFFPDTSIYEAWNSEKARILRKVHINRDFDHQPICKECLIRNQKAQYSLKERALTKKEYIPL